MAVAYTLHKRYLQYLLDCIENDAPLDPPRNVVRWTPDALLMVASVALHEFVKRMQDLDADDATVGAAMDAVAVTASRHVPLTVDNDWDEVFDPMVRLHMRDDGEPEVITGMHGVDG